MTGSKSKLQKQKRTARLFMVFRDCIYIPTSLLLTMNCFYLTVVHAFYENQPTVACICCCIDGSRGQIMGITTQPPLEKKVYHHGKSAQTFLTCNHPKPFSTLLNLIRIQYTSCFHLSLFLFKVPCLPSFQFILFNFSEGQNSS